MASLLLLFVVDVSKFVSFFFRPFFFSKTVCLYGVAYTPDK